MKATTKTLQDRERELQALLATPAGREEIQALATRYHTDSGKVRPANTSVITYILVHERQQGLIPHLTPMSGKVLNWRGVTRPLMRLGSPAGQLGASG